MSSGYTRYGPRKLYAPTSAGNAPLWEIMDLPFLSPTEFVRAKLRCNREYWDLGDISWMASIASLHLVLFTPDTTLTDPINLPRDRS